MGTHTYRHGKSPPQAADALRESEARFRTLAELVALARHGAGGEASVQVTKPFTPTGLLREVRSVLESERPSPPVRG